MNCVKTLASVIATNPRNYELFMLLITNTSTIGISSRDMIKC